LDNTQEGKTDTRKDKNKQVKIEIKRNINQKRDKETQKAGFPVTAG